MNEIKNLNLTSFRSHSVNETTSKATNPINVQDKSSGSDFYIDRKRIDVIRANAGISKNPADILKPISFGDYTAKLRRAGMKEGIDYEIFDYSKDSKTVYIKDKSGEPVKTVFWFGGDDAENYSGYQSIILQKNNSKVITEYDRNNIMSKKSVWYEDANAHKDLFPSGIDLNTTSDEYVSKLKKENIKYDILKNDEKDEKRSLIIEEDAEGNPLKMTDFIEYSDGSKFINQSNSPDKSGSLRHEVSIVSDGEYSDITVTDYVKHLGIRG